MTRTASLAAAAAYLGLSVLFFAIPVLPHFRRDLIGTGSDPQLFVWSLGWWPHAVLDGHNPFVAHVLWTPNGSNLAWTTSIPGLALLLAPVTLAVGAVAAYNTAAILLPALAAWTAFRLCRHLTRSFWASVAGGFLFGFSSYLTAQELGHLHMTSVFLVPLAALALLRFLEGGLGGWGLVVRLGPLLALQLLFSTEVLFTLSLCLAAGLLLGSVVVPAQRRRIAATLPPLARRLRSRCRAHGTARLLRAQRLPGRHHAGDAQPRRPRERRVPGAHHGDRRQPRAALRAVRTGGLGGDGRSTSGCPCSRSSSCSRSAAGGGPGAASSSSRSCSPSSRRSGRSCGYATTRSSRCRGGSCATRRSSTTSSRPASRSTRRSPRA